MNTGARAVAYGLAGWCVEVSWTALHDVVGGRGNSRRLEGHSYLWMPPISPDDHRSNENAHRRKVQSFYSRRTRPRRNCPDSAQSKSCRPPTPVDSSSTERILSAVEVDAAAEMTHVLGGGDCVMLGVHFVGDFEPMPVWMTATVQLCGRCRVRAQHFDIVCPRIRGGVNGGIGANAALKHCYRRVLVVVEPLDQRAFHSADVLVSVFDQG